MGFSVSGSVVIIAIGLFVSFGMFYTATSNGFEQVTEAQQDTHDTRLERQNTDITIINASYNSTSTTLSVSVNNTGSTTLSINETDVLVDNDYQASYQSDVDGNTATDLWQPGETLDIRVNITKLADFRVKIVAGPGIADTTEVSVP